MDLYSENMMFVRSVLAKARQKKIAVIKLDGYSYEERLDQLGTVAKAMYMEIQTRPYKNDGILIRYTPPVVFTEEVKKINQLGESIVVEVKPEKERHFRAVASSYARSIGLSSNVTRLEAGRLKLTLMSQDRYKQKQTTNDAPAPQGRPPLPANKLKYPIGDLDVGESVFIEIADTFKVRVYVTSYSKRHGLRMTCNAKENGILVTRTA